MAAILKIRSISIHIPLSEAEDGCCQPGGNAQLMAKLQLRAGAFLCLTQKYPEPLLIKRQPLTFLPSLRPSNVRKALGIAVPLRRAKSSNICFWLDMELLSPCNSSSRLRRSYSGVIFSFLMAVPPETKIL